MKNDFVLFCVFSISFLNIAAAQPQEIEKLPFENSRVNLTYSKDSQRQTVFINFSAPWDLKDIKKIYLLPWSFYKSAGNIQLKNDVKFKLYGYSIRPFRVINLNIAKNKKTFNGHNGPEDSATKNQTSNKKENKKFINLSALYDDAVENLDSFILEKSLQGVSPQWKTVPEDGKKSFMRDILAIDIWDNSFLAPIGTGIDKISK